MAVNIGESGFHNRTRNIFENVATGPGYSNIVEVEDFDILSLAAETVIDAVCNSEYDWSREYTSWVFNIECDWSRMRSIQKSKMNYSRHSYFGGHI